MRNVTIEPTTCTRCGICVAVCPRGTIHQNSTGELPFADPEGPCTECGHCAAHCPMGALHLQTGPLPPAPYAAPAELSPDEIGNYLCSRRSVRAYQKKPVEREKVDRLFEIVRYAPTGINRQLIRWIIIHKPGEVHRLAGMAIDWLKEQAKTSAEFAARYAPLLKAWEAGQDAICRGAPHLAIALSPNDYGLAHTDVVIALSYFEVAAPAFGIGTCWAGYMDMVINGSPALQKELGIRPGESTLGALLFGYPAYRLRQLPRRKAAVVEWR